MASFLPAPAHRAVLPLAHLVRHYWRRWRKTPISGVSVVITNLTGDVLLLKHSYGPQVWCLPGGGLGRGEEPEAAARREVLEELGIDLVRISPVTVITEEISGAPHTAHLFAATCDQHPRPDGREVVLARFFPSHSLPEPLGRITRTRIDAWRARGLGKAL
jgi:ADP-ribose pyrophosphatase YjhB (NUDIX family)